MIFGGKRKTEAQIDLQQLPVQEIAMILRRLGLQLLDDLLSHKPRPDLATRLTHKECRLLTRSYAWKVSPLRRLLHVPERFPADLTPGIRDMVSSALLGIISRRQWHYRIRDRLALATGMASGSILPHNIWPMAVQAAWADPSFRHEAAWRIHRYQRTRPPLVSGNPAVVMLDPNTFWVLLSLADIRPGRHWIKPVERVRARTADKLRDQARRQACSQRWAGFWDQWIIQLACTRWPDGYRNLPRAYRKALTKVPLMKKTYIPPLKFQLKRGMQSFLRGLFLRPPEEARSLYRAHEEPIDLTRDGWAEEIPDYMGARYLQYKS